MLFESCFFMSYRVQKADILCVKTKYIIQSFEFGINVKLTEEVIIRSLEQKIPLQYKCTSRARDLKFCQTFNDAGKSYWTVKEHLILIELAHAYRQFNYLQWGLLINEHVTSSIYSSQLKPEASLKFIKVARLAKSKI